MRAAVRRGPTHATRHEGGVGFADGAELGVPRRGEVLADVLLQKLLDPTLPGCFHRRGGVSEERSAAPEVLPGGDGAEVQPHLLPHEEL